MSRPAVVINPDGATFDLCVEDLECLISPKNMLLEVSPSLETLSSRGPSTGSSSGSSSFTPSNPKVSPLVTVDCGVESSRPAATSLRGYDKDNKPIYSSSQTPTGFNTVTKRKTSKTSVFNFEGFDAMSGENDTPRSGGDNGNEYLSGADSTAGISSADEEEGTTRRRLTVRTKNLNRERAVHALTTPDDDDDDDDEIEAPVSLSGLAGPPSRSMYNNDCVEDTTFKSTIANIKSGQATANKWEELSPIDRNPRKKGGAFSAKGGSFSPDQTAEVPAASMQPLTTYPPQSGQYGGAPLGTLYLGGYSEYAATQNYYGNVSAPQPMGVSMMSEYTGLTADDLAYAQDAMLPFDDESPGFSSGRDVHVQSYKTYPAMPVTAGAYNPFVSFPTTKPPSATLHRQAYGGRYASHSPEPSNDDDGTGKDKGNRAGKSLAEISKRFVSLFGTETAMQYIAGEAHPDDVSDAIATLHRVDSAAETLQVHVRRIYELIKILEILSFVAFAGDKRGKFSWRGTRHFLHTLGSIQEDGISKYPVIAAQNGLTKIGGAGALGGTSPQKIDLLRSASRETDHSGTEEHFMVEIICKNFLQLFLVGMNSMSMGAVIQRLIPMDDSKSLSEYNKVNATKIRRVYDVTNVLCSLNLLRKKSIPRKKALEAEAWNNCGGLSPIVGDEKGKTPPKSSRSGDRADTKVLEWTSFAPALIRQRFVADMLGT